MEKKITFKSVRLDEYNKIEYPPSNIVYYINNVKGNNVFFKGKQRYHGAIAISKEEELFNLKKVKRRNIYYFNYNTGSVYIYLSNEFKKIQNSWLESPFDNYTNIVNDDIMKIYHNNNISTNTNGMGIYVVNELPSDNIKRGIYFVLRKTKSGLNIYDEYIYVQSKWELISSETDLSNYITEDNLHDKLSNYIILEDLLAILENIKEEILNKFNEYYTKVEIDELLNSINQNIENIKEEILNKFNEYYTKVEIDELLDQYLLKSELENYINEIIKVNIVENTEIEKYYNLQKENYYNSL